MKKMRKAAAWLLTGAICALPCGALAETTKQETVYVKAGATGGVNDVIVETWLRNEDGLSEISDLSWLTGIENVKGEEAFTQNGEQLVWQADGNDIYYRGSTAEQPPVSVKLAYRLDGKEVQPEDIVGQSGHIAIDVSYVNEAQADGSAVPMLMVTAMMLSDDTFSNVTVDNGRVVSDGSTHVVVGMGLPGLAESMKLGENDLTKDIELPEGFTMEADVTDFRMSMTLTAATAFNMDDLGLDEMTGIDDLRDSLEELTDASTQLVDGTGELLDGVQTLLDASVELKDGTATLDEKMGELADGLAELNGKKGTLVKGVSDLDKGAAALATGLNTLKQGVQAYTSGAATLAEGVVAYASGADALATGTRAYVSGAQQLTGGLSEYVSGVDTLAAGTQAYVSGAQQLTGGLSEYVSGADALAAGTEAYVAGAQQLTEGIASLGGGASSYLLGVSKLTAGIDAANAAAAQMGGAEQWQAQAAAAQQLAGTGASIGQQVSAIAADVQAASEIKDCLSASIASDEKLLGVAQTLSGYIDELDDAHRDTIRSLYNECVSEITGSIANQKQALDVYSKYLSDADAEALSGQLAALSQQVEALAGGVGQNATAVLTVQGTLAKLAENTGTLNEASADMSAGLAQLSAGATALSANDEALLAGAAQLTEAGKALSAGATALSANDEALLAGAAQLTEAGAALTAGATALNENSAALNAGASSANSGAAQLKSGTAQLKSGSATLSEGIEKLSDGGSQLKEGTEELAQAGIDLEDGVGDLFDGAEELADGMAEFDEEGIQELNRVLDEDLQGVLDDIRAAADAGKAYRNWMGLAAGMNGKVQFIIETAGVE